MARNSFNDNSYQNVFEKEYEMEEEYEEEYDDDYDEIDNSDLSYTGQSICIRLNEEFGEWEKRNRLKVSEDILYKKYPKFKEISSEGRLEEILDGVFPEGFNKQMYIRNLTFTNRGGRDVSVLGIRPERMPGDFLATYMPMESSLLFKGHIQGKEFIVDAIHDVADSEQLDYEVNCVATQYKNPGMIRGNFLYDVLRDTDSITQHTEEKLEEWRDYIHWKEELAKRQIYGCKYYKVTFDEENKYLVFWLVCESKEYFDAFRRYLRRDIQVFDNDYSKNQWRFEFNDDHNNRKRRYNSVEVGRYKRIVDQYYLKEKTDTETISGTIENQPNDRDDYDENDDYYDEGDFYDEEDVVETEDDVFKAFDNPYIVKVAYELNRADLDAINDRNLDDDSVIQYVYDYVLANYYSNGFLALSAIGEFVLLNRFGQAINQLERDECYSPNLSLWLFNVSRARLPEEDTEVVIDKWLNDKIEKNENQRIAVQKMIAAPDLCLIQGPPGTGKTTVIAEAIYQLTRTGNRVLVASQSNDAVDNALERLADTPEIRAIRLGQKSKRKRKEQDISTRKFAEDEALKYYYNALSLKVSKNWLNIWDELESGGEQYDVDIRDAKFFVKDLVELNTRLAKQNELYEIVKTEYNKLHEDAARANDDNTRLENDKYQYKLLISNYKGESVEQYYLSSNMVQIFEVALNPLVDKAFARGVYMTPGKLDLDIMGVEKESAYISFVIKNIDTISALREKIKESEGKDNKSDADVLILQAQMSEIKDKMLNCIEDADEEGEAEYRKKYLSLKKQIDELKNQSSTIIVSEKERRILSNSFLDMINSSSGQECATVLDQIILEWSSAIDKAIAVIGKLLDSRKLIDISAINEKILSSEGRYNAIKEEIRQIREQIAIKKQTLLKLREKYGVESTKVDEIIEHIQKLKADNIRKLEGQREFRNDWEKTLRSFKNRLEDIDSFKYDQEYYQKIYVNACNVVGISCTDNMRNLTENGYDDFDVVIIDEVSKATPPELLIPLMKARKAILVGDHRQLPPMFKEHEGSYKELIENQENIPEELRDLLTKVNFDRFKKMVTSSLFKDYFEQADENIKHSLLVQYRMHSDIMAIINRFYEQRLTNGLSVDVEKLEKNHGLTIKGVDRSTFVEPNKHAYWIDSSALPNGTPIYETFPTTSACNILEKYIIIELLKKIAEAYKEQGYSNNNRKTIGVISFYQAQVNEIRDAFKIAKRSFDFSAVDVDINTVDRFQGKEKNIIITSLVRNNKSTKVSEHVVAFERINVAFSRAQELLFIVGAKHMYENSMVQLPNMDMPGFKTVPVYKNIMEDLHRKACFRTSNKIIPEDLEMTILNEYKEKEGDAK